VISSSFSIQSGGLLDCCLPNCCQNGKEWPHCQRFYLQSQLRMSAASRLVIYSHERTNIRKVRQQAPYIIVHCGRNWRRGKRFAFGIASIPPRTRFSRSMAPHFRAIDYAEQNVQSPTTQEALGLSNSSCNTGFSHVDNSSIDGLWESPPAMVQIPAQLTP
jgi:hypothetical protein